MVQAFAPVLAHNGGGAVVNVLSALSWLTLPGSGGYSASKAAAWALGNALRQELKAHRTGLLAVHAAFIDTDMARGALGPKLAPDDARAADARGAGGRAARAAGRRADTRGASWPGGRSAGLPSRARVNGAPPFIKKEFKR